MHDHMILDSQNPTHIFHKKTQKPKKKISKPQTLSLNAWNAWRRERSDHLPSGSCLEWAVKHFGEEIWVREESMS